MQVHRLGCAFAAGAMGFHRQGRGAIQGILIDRPDAAFHKGPLAKQVCAQVDRIVAHAGVGVIKEIAANVRGEAVAVPVSHWISGLGSRDAVVGAVAIDGQDKPVPFFVINDVGVEYAAAVGHAGKETGEGGRPLQQVAIFVVDLESDVDHSNDAVGSHREFGIGRDITTAAAAIGVIKAVESGPPARRALRPRSARLIGALHLSGGRQQQGFGP